MSRRGGRTVEEWRTAILKVDGLKPGPRLYLAYLGEHMDHLRIVARPRALIARDLGVTSRTIDNWNTAAVRAGVLGVIERGQKGVTAVYQGLFPDPVSARSTLRSKPVQREDCIRAETRTKFRAEPTRTGLQRETGCAPVVPQTTRNPPASPDQPWRTTPAAPEPPAWLDHDEPVDPHVPPTGDPLEDPAGHSRTDEISHRSSSPAAAAPAVTRQAAAARSRAREHEQMRSRAREEHP